MELSYRKRAGLAAAVGLAGPVVTIIYYMATLGGPEGNSYEQVSTYFTERWPELVSVWLTENVFLFIGAVAAMGLAAGRGAERAAWNAIALGSVMAVLSNTLAIGMFRATGTIGEEFLPVFRAVLNASFFLFFLCKAAVAIGVAGLSWSLVRSGGALGKIIGLIVFLVGLAAFAVNLVAMARGLELVVPGAFTGSVAAALGALVAFLVTRSAPAGSEESA
ncbi:MAG: hypothetical protein AAFX52_15520 [Pseudomonadota bacterium]